MSACANNYYSFLIHSNSQPYPNLIVALETRFMQAVKRNTSLLQLCFAKSVGLEAWLLENGLYV